MFLKYLLTSAGVWRRIHLLQLCVFHLPDRVSDDKNKILALESSRVSDNKNKILALEDNQLCTCVRSCRAFSI